MGSGKKLEDKTGSLLVIYMMYQFRSGVWIVLHENVEGFITSALTDCAESYGYGHLQIFTRPTDVGFHVGRPRKHFNCMSNYVIRCTRFQPQIVQAPSNPRNRDV